MLIRSLLIVLVLPHLSAADDPRGQAIEQGQWILTAFDNACALDIKPDKAGARVAYQAIVDAPLPSEALVNVMGTIDWTYYNIACIETLHGDPQTALRLLERAISFGFDDHPHMAKDSDLDHLRPLPRYQELVKLAQARSAERTETGTLFLPENQVNVLLQPEDMDRLALRIPAAGTIRERAIVLKCTKTQRQELLTLMDRKKTVAVTGSGGTSSTFFKFTVSAFSAIPAAQPGAAK